MDSKQNLAKNYVYDNNSPPYRNILIEVAQ